MQAFEEFDKGAEAPYAVTFGNPREDVNMLREGHHGTLRRERVQEKS